MSWNNLDTLNVAFVGTGAQGAAIGADFIVAGHNVTFIEQWPDHVEAIRQNGVTVNFPTRTLTTPANCYHFCQVAELREKFDLLFVVVKAYDTRWVCELIKPIVAADGLVVGMQNGMTQDAITDVLGAERCVGAVFDMASNMFVPGVTNRQNDHDTSWFGVGAVDPSNRDRVMKIAELMRCSGRAELSEDIRSSKWMKLIVNAAQLVPSAILNLPFKEAAALPGVGDLMRRAGYEAMQAALADGAKPVPILGMQPPKENDPDRFVDALFDEVFENFMMGDTLTTVLQDWRKGRRGEAVDINGFVVSTLAAAGTVAPVNRRIVELARSIERGEIEADRANAGVLIGA